MTGSHGTHCQVTGGSEDREETLKRLKQYRMVAPEGLAYRMARQAIIATITIEDV